MNLTKLFETTKDRLRLALSYIEDKLETQPNTKKIVAKYGLFIFGMGCLLSTDFFNWIIDSGLIFVGAAAITLSFEAFRKERTVQNKTLYPKLPSIEEINDVLKRYKPSSTDIMLDHNKSNIDNNFESGKVNLNQKYLDSINSEDQ